MPPMTCPSQLLRPVPSIAMEFVRNREKHDQTARQWTQLYAQPKPPLPPTPTTLKQKGKRRDTRHELRSSTAASTSLVGDTITVDDSDDEERVDRDSSRSRRPARTTGYKRTREGLIGLNSTETPRDEVVTNASRHIPCRRSVERILDVDDSEETGSGSGHRHKRTRHGPGSSTTPQQSEEVIVIDD